MPSSAVVLNLWEHQMRPESAQKDPFTHAVIGRAMEVHRALGPGLDEIFYHRLLSEKLAAAGIEHLLKPRRELLHRGLVADLFEPDMVFPGRLIAELKVLRGAFAPAHITQLLCYQKCWDISTGLLFDFEKESLNFKRIIYTPVNAPFPPAEVPAFVSNRDLAMLLVRLVGEMLAAHGLGYRETSYQGMLSAALKAEGVPFSAQPLCPVGKLGSATLRCFIVGGECCVTLTALGERLTAADRAITQTYLRWLNLPWGLAVHFGRAWLDMQFVVRPGVSAHRFKATAD